MDLYQLIKIYRTTNIGKDKNYLAMLQIIKGIYCIFPFIYSSTGFLSFSKVVLS